MKTFPKFNFLFETSDRPARLGRYFLLIASLRLKEEGEKGEGGREENFLGRTKTFTFACHYSSVLLILGDPKQEFGERRND